MTFRNIFEITKYSTYFLTTSSLEQCMRNEDCLKTLWKEDNSILSLNPARLGQAMNLWVQAIYYITLTEVEEIKTYFVRGIAHLIILGVKVEGYLTFGVFNLGPIVISIVEGIQIRIFIKNLSHKEGFETSTPLQKLW